MCDNEKPVIAGLRSMKIETQPGTYFWCSCGRSKNQPFCDSSHRGTNFVPLMVKIEEKTLVKWCTCKHTKTPPHCDHTHRELPGYEAKD